MAEVEYETLMGSSDGVTLNNGLIRPLIDVRTCLPSNGTMSARMRMNRIIIINVVKSLPQQEGLWRVGRGPLGVCEVVHRMMLARMMMNMVWQVLKEYFSSFFQLTGTWKRS